MTYNVPFSPCGISFFLHNLFHDPVTRYIEVHVFLEVFELWHIMSVCINLVLVLTCHLGGTSPGQWRQGEKKWGKERCKAAWGSELPCGPLFPTGTGSRAHCWTWFCPAGLGTFSTRIARKERIGSTCLAPSWLPLTLDWVSYRRDLIPPDFRVVSSGPSEAPRKPVPKSWNVAFHPNLDAVEVRGWGSWIWEGR